MKKKCVVFYFKGTPIAVCEVKEVESIEFIKLEKDCEFNLRVIENGIKNQNKSTQEQLDAIKKEIKYLKGEED